MPHSNRTGSTILLAALVIMLFSCAHFKAQSPSGFAAYKSRCTFKAVSPDGVIYRVRSVKNKPKAELPFWNEAVITRMKNAGYTLVDTSSITVQGRQTFVTELAAPLGSEDQSYLIAVIYGPKRLTVVEAACEVSKFQKRKADIVEAIKKIRLK
jgi:hypothetical protein